MNLTSTLRFVVLVTAVAVTQGCVTTVLGQGPTDRDLRNDGSPEAQDGLYRHYEVVYDQQVFRRPGVAPDVVAQELGLQHVDDVSAFAFSDDAFNYLSASQRATELMEHPAVGFDAFAKSGQGQLIILGTGIGVGGVAGGVAWFARTTLRDGLTDGEANDLWLSAGGGFVVGAVLGAIVSAAYTYIVPVLSTPLATPLYRQAARAFNEDLDERLRAAAPAGDAPPDEGDDADAGDDTADEGADAAPLSPQPTTPTLEPASPAAASTPAGSTPAAGT